MSKKNEIFEQYIKEKTTISNFWKKPKFWPVLAIVIVGLFLIVQLYLSKLKTLSAEELKKSIKVTWNESKWVNKEVTPYGVTIVPSINFKIKNVGEKPIQNIKFVGVFIFEDSGDQLSDGVTPAFKKGLPPGQISEEILIKALNGYKATSKAAFLKNKERWKKVKVRVFAKSSEGFAQIGTFPVDQSIEGMEFEHKSETGVENSEKKYISDQLRRSVQIVWHDSSWIYKKAGSDEIIFVPSITIKIKNIGETPLHYVSIRGNFENEKTSELFSQGITIALSEPLSPQKTSGDIFIKAEYGYTAPSLEALEQHKSKIENLKVRLFAKTKLSGDVLLGIFPIKGVIKSTER